jgi:hypothetical protein
MDLATILDQFAEAEHRVGDGIELIERHRALIARRRGQGLDTAAEEEALRRLQCVQDANIAARDRALAALRIALIRE